MSNMRRFLVALVSLWCLTACTSMGGTPGPTQSSQIEGGFPSEATSGPVTPSASISASSDPAIMNAMVCDPPSDAVMDWLRQPTSFPHLTGSDVVMVNAGEGVNAGEFWWVVSVQWSEDDSRRLTSFLTNEPSASRPSGQVWIRLDSSWSGVAWTGERLVTGLSAQGKAQSCLGQTR